MSQIYSKSKRRRLPSLHHLRAFEAAARHESITLAAEELHVTQSAVSHQVKALETYLGVPLFKRQGREILLTDAGRRYFPEIDAAFDRLAQATEDLGRTRHRPTLTVNVTASVATRWLIPRLSSFCEAHPDVEVHLATVEKVLDFNPQLFDVSIRCLDAATLASVRRRRDWEGVASEPFLDEALFVVCSPRLLDTTPLSKPADLRHHTLLHSSSGPDAWKQWLAEAGLPLLKPRAELTFDKFHLSLQAAARGLGVAIGSLPLTAEELANGSLLAPFPGILSQRKQYHWLSPAKATDRPEVRDFCAWLAACGAAGNLPQTPPPAPAAAARRAGRARPPSAPAATRAGKKG
jgi:LysR family glycine cleavage system transcriptional activator